MMLKKLDDCNLDVEDEKSCSLVMKTLKILHSLQTSDGMLGKRKQDYPNSIPGLSQASHVINVFGGVQIVVSLLFHPDVRPSQDLNNLFCTPRNSCA